MIRRIPLTLLLTIAMMASASATTYYVASNGSDSNNGTSKTTAWQHAPGMPNCTATCKSTNPKAGDQIVFRGGDTWHLSAGTPLVGGQWNWTWSGTSASPIYVGVDKTWFSGSTWVRPIFTGDNTPTTSFVSSCAHETPNGFYASNQSYVTIDNFEWTGKCWSSGDGPFSIYIGQPNHTGSHMTVSNMYFHGWMTCSGCTDDGYAILGYANNPQANPISTITQNVFDGSDTHCNGGNDCEGFSIYGDCTNVTNNYFHNVSNVGVCDDTITFAGNLIDGSYEPFDPNTHGNVMEWLGYNPSGTQPIYVYNNITKNVTNGETYDVAVTISGYVFNNVFFNNGNGANMYMDETGKSGETGVNDYWYNNTLGDNTGTLRFFGNGNGRVWNGRTTFQNNHIIGYSPNALSSVYNCNAGALCNITDNGSEIYQSQSAANGQGYVPSNNYAPTAASNSTVNAGINATSFCNSIPDATASAACKNGNATVTYDSLKHAVVLPTPVPRPSSGAWDSGAYEYTASDTVNPPSGLSAIVH
jgi:hypothetical protein